MSQVFCKWKLWCARLFMIPALLGCIPTAGVQAQTPLPGLGTDSLVAYDSNGVPHICAGSDLDAIFMLGYVHAQDRFFQMDTLRHTFSGTLAELVGPGALGSDVQLRTFGLRRAAEASYLAYGAAGLTDTIEFLETYVRGVNRYLESHPLPPEYAALEITQVSPWTVVDTLVLGSGLAFSLSFSLDELDLTVQAGAYQAVGGQAGFDGLQLLFGDVVRHAPFDATISLPQDGASVTPESAKQSAAQRFAAPSAEAVELARKYLEEASKVPLLEKALKPRAVDTGSNWWILSGEKSTSGYPMLANDPHLGLDTPSTFYEAHLISSAEEQCGLGAAAGLVVGESFVASVPGVARQNPSKAVGLNANGVSFAGAPGLVQGCNDEICWGSTVNPMDVTDVYQEALVVDANTGLPTHTIFDGQPEPLVFIPQTYLVNQIGDQVPDNRVDAGLGPLDGGVTLIVPRRNNGPIVSLLANGSGELQAGLSIQYTGWSGTLNFEAFRRWLRAGNVNEFVEGVQYFDVGSQNWAYADVHGDIAYFTSAELPIREDLQTLGFPDGGVPPFLIRDGTHTLRHEWMEVQNPQPQQALGFEILPFAEMPQTVNPAAGYVINANNDPVGNTLDNNVLNEARPGGGVFYLSPGYASLRVGRIGRLIEKLLAEGGKATAQDLKTMQANNQLLEAELLSPFLIQAFANAADPAAPAELTALGQDPGIAEAITRLMAWDFSTPTGIQAGYDPGDDPNNLPAPSENEIANSVAATIWSAWRGQIIASVIDGTLSGLGLGDFLPDNRSAYNALANLLMNFETQNGAGTSGVMFFGPPAGSSSNFTAAQARDTRLLQSLRDALDLLASDEFAPAFGNSTNQNDYRWGYLHRIEFDHILGGPFSIPSAGGFQHLAPDLPGIARSGGYEAVDASRHSSRANSLNGFTFGAGPARRFVGVLDPQGIQAEEILPGGQSGVVFSPNYASQLGRWLTNDYHPLLLSTADVVADIQSREEFEPACVPGANVFCFHNNRFKVEVEWDVPNFGSGPGGTVAGASDVSGNFYFFNPQNWEMLVKVLDGCDVNGHYWVFLSAATDVAWEVTVEDTESGAVWSQSNPFGQPSPAVTDTMAFSTCP